MKKKSVKDNSHERIIPQTTSYCQDCKKKLKPKDAALQNRLRNKDGKVICTDCHEKRYLSATEKADNKRKPDKYPTTEVFSQYYHSLLKSQAKYLSILTSKLKSDPELHELFSAAQGAKLNTPVKDFISHCVVYDLCQITNMLTNNSISDDRLEAIGLALTTRAVLNKKMSPNVEDDYQKLRRAIENDKLKATIHSLCENVQNESPVQINLKENSLPGASLILNLFSR